MNYEYRKALQDLNVNFDGKIAIYYDDLKGNRKRKVYIYLKILNFQ